MLGKITKTTAERLQPGQLLWDTVVVGFGARRQRRDVFYLLRYRFAGRQRFITIGRHGSPWTPDTARNEARRLLGLVASRIDPAVKQSDGGETFGAIIPTFLQRRQGSIRPRSFVELERYLTGDYTACLRRSRLADIDRRSVALCLGQIETANGAVTRNRARSALSSFFTWAVAEGLSEANVVAGTGKADEGGSRERVLTNTELSSVLAALGTDSFGEIVRLLTLTGQRRQEIGGLRWGEIDFARGLIVLPASRTKNRREHLLPMPAQVRAIIERQPHRDHTDLIFGYGVNGFIGFSKGKAALDQRLSLPPWRLHDLRRSAATGMAELGVQPHVIEAILNHISGHKASVAGIYNRAKYLEPMREALQRWADHIEQITRS